MICHVKTLDTWANRTWKWSEIMISQILGESSTKYLFNRPILSTLLLWTVTSLFIFGSILSVVVWCALLAAGACAVSVPCLLFGYPVQISVSAPCSLHTKPTWHSTFLLASLHRLVQNQFEICLVPALTLTVSWEAPIGSQKQPHTNQWELEGDPKC